MDAIGLAFSLVFTTNVLVTILVSGLFGLIIGAIPGLTATMATALLVPVTFFMAPIPAVAAIITCSAMAIFAGDIPATLLRIPGTPSSAAYVDDAYAMALRGQAELCLGVNLVYSALGGLLGSVVLIVAAPTLANIVLDFGTFEYFWLCVLGLSCAVFISQASLTRGVVSLLIGLLASTVGIGSTSGFPRFTFGNVDLMGGINFVVVLIGMFAMAEILRGVTASADKSALITTPIGNIFSGIAATFRPYWKQFATGSTIGVIIGILPGAGSTLAAFVSYAFSRKASRHPEQYGKGSLEGIIASTSANNAAVSGAWTPALVFGIPGDAVTAIAIGVLYMKGLDPGPMIFINNPQNVYAVLICFFVANLVMVPIGFAFIRVSRSVLKVSKDILLPIILILSIVGSFAINNTLFDVGVMLISGVIAYLMEENDIPVAPAVLGLLLGTLLEDNFMTSMIKAHGNLLYFFERPIAGGLGVFTLLLWLSPLLLWLFRRARGRHQGR